MHVIRFRKIEGSLKIRVDNAEDLWALQRILFQDDVVKSESMRRFRPSEGDEGEMKEVVITLRVEKTELDRNALALRVTGKIVDGRPLEYVKLNTYHTLGIGVHDVVEITKKSWPNYILNVIKEAVEDTKKPRLAVVLLDDEKALPAYVLGYGVEFLNEVYSKLSKRMKPKDFEEQKEKYFKNVIEVISNFNTDTVIVAGPGFTREDIKKYIEEKGFSGKIGKRLIYERASDTERTGMYELIRSESVENAMVKGRLRGEFKTMEEFLSALNVGKAGYGLDRVREAVENYEANIILVNDSVLGNPEVQKTLSEAEEHKIRIIIINSSGEAGVQLHGFKDIAFT
jgi:protein pelota